MTSGRRCAIPESELFWDQVLQRVDEGTVVPVVGRDLLRVSIEGVETPLYPWLAARLAEALDLSGADLPKGGEVEEVARRHLTEPRTRRDIYRELRNILGGLDPDAVPRPLSQLARISNFKLYVTTTFDFLTERAVDEARYGGQRQTLVFSYAPNDKQDLPRELDRLNRPAVFHLLGRVSGTPRSYAVTREDTLEFINSLEAKTGDSPQFLYDKLRSSSLLILGSHLADWLVRFVTRSDSRPRAVETRGAPVLFLRHSGGGTKLFRRGGSAEDFVDELDRRWSESRPTDVPAAPPPALAELMASPGLQPGFVFLSYARDDQAAAKSIRGALDRAGVDVIVDDDTSPVDGKWEKKLRSILSECAVFVPLISTESATRQRRFFKREWVDTILEASRAVASGPFVMPVVIDDTSPRAAAIPEAFGAAEWRKLPGGKPTAEFVETVVQLQRRYRSASFA